MTNTIWNCLAEKLGREPTAAEVKAEVRRIIAEAQKQTPKDAAYTAGGKTFDTMSDAFEYANLVFSQKRIVLGIEKKTI